MNHANTGWEGSAGEILVTLDGATVVLPVGRNSLAGIRTYLETLALARQRVLAVLAVDRSPVNLALPLVDDPSFSRVDGETIPLEELPSLLLTTAGQQVSRARESVENALTLVLINPPATARELWWKTACLLKEPVLTLSLMPENICRLSGGTSFLKLRRWQLEQIAAIVQQVDLVCETQDNILLSDTLENLLLPWLQKLEEHIQLWQEATLAGTRLGIRLE